ncbi:MAG: hypothetical protein ACPHW3_03315 [Candidatus Puniceispirillales bacterium]
MNSYFYIAFTATSLTCHPDGSDTSQIAPFYLCTWPIMLCG